MNYTRIADCFLAIISVAAFLLIIALFTLTSCASGNKGVDNTDQSRVAVTPVDTHATTQTAGRDISHSGNTRNTTGVTGAEVNAIVANQIHTFQRDFFIYGGLAYGLHVILSNWANWVVTLRANRRVKSDK